MGALDCVSKKENNTGSIEVISVTTSSDSNLNVPRTDLEAHDVSKSNKGVQRHSILWHFLTDLPLFLLASVTLILFELNILPTTKSGFYCNDPALSFPYKGESVSKVKLLLTVLLMPLSIILGLEFVTDHSGSKIKVRILNACKRTFIIYRNFLFGLFMTMATVEALKVVSGFPRPVFFALCEPDTARNCTGSEYVSTFTCTSTQYSSWVQNDASHSFPSGHAALSVYNGLHMAWYIQKRIFDWGNRCVFIIPFNQALRVIYAIDTSMSRITDRVHHWWDVLAGVIIALACVYYNVFVLNKDYKRPEDTETEEIENPRRELLS